MKRLQCPSLLLILLYFSGLSIGCDDSKSNAAECKSDQDCRAGFRCDLLIFVGECVQEQQVVRCGDQLCFLPDEMCYENQCVDFDPSLNPMNGNEAGNQTDGQNGGNQEGGARGGSQSSESEGGNGSGGVSGEQMNEEQGGENPQGGQNDIGGDPGGEEMIIEFRDSDLMIDSPQNNQLFSLDHQLQVRGHIPLESRPILNTASLSLVVLSQGEQSQTLDPQMLSWNTQGEFELSLSLTPGSHTLVFSLENEYTSLQKYIFIRLDEPVQAQGVNLKWGEQNYRFFGVYLPTLLPTLSQLEPYQRASFLRQVWSDLKALNVNVAKIFIGFTQDPLTLYSAPNQLDPVGIDLLDLVVAEAGYAGLKLVFTLGDGSEEYQGYQSYLNWSGIERPTPEDDALFYRGGQAQEAFLNLIELLPAHLNPITSLFYRDDPAILAWEILHLPQWDHLLNQPQFNQSISDFFVRASLRLSQAAPHQLIWTGEVGLDQNSTPYEPYGSQLAQYQAQTLLQGQKGGNWFLHSTRTHTQVAAFALYPPLFPQLQNTQLPHFGQLWIRAHSAANLSPRPQSPNSQNTNQNALPLVMHLVRFPRTELSNDLQSQILRQWTTIARSQGVNGFILGDFIFESDAFTSSQTQWLINHPHTSEIIQTLAQDFTYLSP